VLPHEQTFEPGMYATANPEWDQHAFAEINLLSFSGNKNIKV